MKYQNLDLKLSPSIKVCIQEVPNLLNLLKECKNMTKTIKVSTPVTAIPLIIIALEFFKILLLFIIWDFISMRHVKNSDKKFSSTYLIVKLKNTSHDIACKMDFARAGHFLNKRIVLRAPTNPVTTRTPRFTAIN